MKKLVRNVKVDLSALYNAKSLKTMARFVRGHTLISDRRVLTREMMDKVLLEDRQRALGVMSSLSRGSVPLALERVWTRTP